jgi:hypothetical protein
MVCPNQLHSLPSFLDSVRRPAVVIGDGAEAHLLLKYNERAGVDTGAIEYVQY